MRFEGRFELEAERERVWEFISDPAKVIQCVPGIEDYSVGEGKRVTARVKVKIGFIRGVFHAASKVLEERSDEYKAKLELTGSGAGSGFKALVDIGLEEIEERTKVAWAADVNVSGPLGSLAKPMLQGYVKKLVEQLFDCVKQRLQR